MEEKMEQKFIIQIERVDGIRMNMKVRPKNVNHKKRKVKTWTNDEDQQLARLYDQNPKKWAFIASQMTDRN